MMITAAHDTALSLCRSGRHARNVWMKLASTCLELRETPACCLSRLTLDSSFCPQVRGHIFYMRREQYQKIICALLPLPSFEYWTAWTTKLFGTTLRGSGISFRTQFLALLACGSPSIRAYRDAQNSPGVRTFATRQARRGSVMGQLSRAWKRHLLVRLTQKTGSQLT